MKLNEKYCLLILSLLLVSIEPMKAKSYEDEIIAVLGYGTIAFITVELTKYLYYKATLATANHEELKTKYLDILMGSSHAQLKRKANFLEKELQDTCLINISADVPLHNLMILLSDASDNDVIWIIRDAKRLAKKENANNVTLLHIEKSYLAYTKSDVFLKNKLNETTTAYHEAGHAVAAIELSNKITVVKAAIVKKLIEPSIFEFIRTGDYQGGIQYGCVSFIDKPQFFTLFRTENDHLDMIAISLASDVTEKKFNRPFSAGPGYSLGCMDDVKRAKAIADKLAAPACNRKKLYGWSQENELSDQQCQQLKDNYLKIGRARAEKVIEKNKDKVEKVKNQLLKKKILYANEIYNLCDKPGPL